MEKYGNCGSEFLHTHMFMYTKHVPQTILWLVVVLVLVPDGSASVRIVNSLNQDVYIYTI